MTSGADLFVVCKQCGSEVSPYITECPYCGHRLRRRAPKLPRAHAPARAAGGRARLGAVLGGRRRRAAREPFGVGPSYGSGRWEGTRPYATIAIVAASCGIWVAGRASPSLRGELAVLGPLHGDWWRLFSTSFVYFNGVYTFSTLIAIAIFGWLLERRHGPLLVLALFIGAGAAGAVVAEAVYPFAIATGGNAGALALLAAWAAPDLRAARSGTYYDGDLLGTAVIAALLLAMPFAIYEASWLAGVTGGAIGLLVGLGLSRLGGDDR
jgi:hypothetical protein